MVGLAVWAPFLGGLLAMTVGLLGAVVVVEGAVGF